jgi:hypothetical protein
MVDIAKWGKVEDGLRDMLGRDESNAGSGGGKGLSSPFASATL